MRLANTADAVAYSGLVWEARGLNYQAYLNRVMVSNQVTIGQLVSIMSWMQYLEISARNIDATLGSGIKALLKARFWPEKSNQT